MQNFNVETWAKEFFEQTQHPMSDLQSRMFIHLTMADKDFVTDEIKSSFSYQVASSRADHMKLEFDAAAMVFLTVIAESPAAIVMYLSAFKAVDLSITINNIVDKFPMGFLSEESLGEMWNKQKGKVVDNELDSIAWS